MRENARVRPLDPRLLRYAAATKTFLVLAVIIGVATAILIIVQARLLSDIIVNVSANGATWDAVAGTVAVLLLLFIARGLLAWLAELAAYRTSSRAKLELRQAALEHVQGGNPGEITALLTRGIDALDGYYSRYLPQLVLSVIVPIAVILTVLGQDLISTIIIVVTLPLIPVFMILIGLYTKTRVEKQWNTLTMLSGHFLDLIAGLPTLKVLGRAKAQAAAITAIGERYRSTTMGVLRVSFLSSLALELLATLSVALVAVSVGLRLAQGQLQYSVALFVLLLAPEAYLPLRLVGQHFHAAAEGLGAADRIFTLIETDDAPVVSKVASVNELVVSNVTYTYPERTQQAVGELSFSVRRGDVCAIVGPSGSGKSTLVDILLGLKLPSSGRVEVDGVPGIPVCSWVPQHPNLVTADGSRTVRDVVALGSPEATDDEVLSALAAAHIRDEILARPDGLYTVLGADGSGFSAGQLRRIAIARALLPNAPVLILDEPTAALDQASEQAIIETITARADRIVIVVAHRPAVLEVANVIVRMPETRTDDVGEERPLLSSTITASGW